MPHLPEAKGFNAKRGVQLTLRNEAFQLGQSRIVGLQRYCVTIVPGVELLPGIEIGTRAALYIAGVTFRWADARRYACVAAGTTSNDRQC